MKAAHVVSLSLLSFGVLVGGMYIAAKNAPVTVVLPPSPPAPATNGFPRLQAAARQLVRTGDTADALSSRTKPAWGLAKKRELIAANRATLNDARVALRLPYRETNTIDSLNDDGYPQGKPFRNLARTLTLAGEVAWESGDQAESVGWYMDAITLGRRIPNRVGLEGMSVGLACESIGRKPLWRHLDALSPQVAAQCLARLNALAAHRVPLSVAIEEEKWSIQSTALECMTHPERIRREPDADDTPNESGVYYGDVVPPRYVINTMGGYMDKLIAQS
ncbi:MAG: hypothetical protein H7Y38_19270 [Armatimonadetes bacterium]|nr:hypothetical protein [Armatimonadota bacterium]